MDTLVDYLRRLLGLEPSSGVRRQCGAIPVRRGADGIEFLLVTTRRSGRWIFPKGDRMLTRTRAGAAAQEALEEAGVTGRIGRRPLGRYASFKSQDPAGQAIDVEMYLLEVTDVLEDWPEKGQRRRHWADADEASSLVSEPELVPMIHRALAEVAAQ